MIRFLSVALILLFITTLTLGYLLFMQNRPQAEPVKTSVQEARFSPSLSFTPKELVFKRGCTNCHDLKNTLVGPSFEAIAERYHQDQDAADSLFLSLRQGSSGKWSSAMAMPTQPIERVNDEEAIAILDWVLGLGH